MNSSPDPNKPDDSDGCPGRLNELQDLQKQLSKIADSVEPASTSPRLAEQVERRQRRQQIQQKVAKTTAATAVAASIIGVFVILQPPMVSQHSETNAAPADSVAEKMSEKLSAKKESATAEGKAKDGKNVRGSYDKEAAQPDSSTLRSTPASPTSGNPASPDVGALPASRDATSLDAAHFLFPTPGKSARRRAKVLAFMTWSAAKECNIQVTDSLRDALVSSGAWSRDHTLDAERGFGGAQEALVFQQSLTQDERLCISQKQAQTFGTVDTAASHGELLRQQLVGHALVDRHRRTAIQCLADKTNSDASNIVDKGSFEEQVRKIFDLFAPTGPQGKRDEQLRRTFGVFYSSCTKTYFNQIREMTSDPVATLRSEKTQEIENFAQTLRHKGYQP